MNHTPTNPEAESKEAHPLDPRIANALQELGICYDTDPEGNFYMLVEFDDNRFQQVCIRSRTQEFLGVELRQIFSTALVSEGLFEPRTANLLLRENFDLIHGSWSVLHDPDENEHFANFSLTAFASLHAVQLSPLIECVASTADDMENRLSGLDEF